MPPPRRPLPDSLDGAFTVGQARAAGVTAGRLRGRDLEVPFRGVRRAAPSAKAAGAEGANGDVANAEAAERPAKRMTPDEFAQARVRRQATDYSAIMRPAEFFAGRSAAALYRIPIDYGDQLVVAVRKPARSTRRGDVRGIHVSRSLVAVRVHEGLRVSTPASTWAMLAAELTVRELVIAGDAIVRAPRGDHGRKHPELRLATLDQLRRAIDAGRRVGIERLREAIEQIREGSASPLETDYRLIAAASGLPEPELDVEIRTPHGQLLGISDLVYRAQRVAVEVEGDHHRTDRAQWARDLEKYADYAREGWEVVRVAGSHIRGPSPRAVEMVRSALIDRGWTPGRPGSATAVAQQRLP